MKETGKTPVELASILRNIAGWTGWFQFMAFYVQGAFLLFPVNDDKNKNRVQDAMGVLGLKLMRLAYDTDYVSAHACVYDIRKVFNSFIEEEVTNAQYVFASGTTKQQPRKSSILRTSNRRLSDTELLYMAADSMKRLSIAAAKDTSPITIFESSDLMQ